MNRNLEFILKYPAPENFIYVRRSLFGIFAEFAVFLTTIFFMAGTPVSNPSDVESGDASTTGLPGGHISAAGSPGSHSSTAGIAATPFSDGVTDGHFNAAHPKDPGRYEFRQVHMGTDVRIILYAPDSLTAQTAADAAYHRIGELELILSDYIDKSELNRLSALSGTGESVQVSETLFNLLQKSREISEATNGAFDITIGPYVELWRVSRRTERLVSRREMEIAGRSVGYEYILLDHENRSVELQKKGMQLDVGGIGKGYASDEALSVLREHGIESALVASAGDIAVGNAPPGRDGWDIDLFVVNQEGERRRQSVTLTNRGISTSGDLFQYLEINGIRYSHIIDPETGLGLTSQGFVTVIASDALTADSKASAFSVMGPQDTDRFIRQSDDLEFYYIIPEENGYGSRYSDGFRKLLSKL